ncbi:hypothetical protein [Methylorubrum sp. GM97]|uniref:hypothetical protein n=1 Tax=Methylorubrum sp. GM97 TaxID=2938232 RepID=UPI0021C393C3|nr:hypothetical protein [Methylorubrum sp. GM97]
MKRFLASFSVLLAFAAPTFAQTRALPPGEIRANGDITFGNALKLGKREGNKTVITPDTLQILGPGSTGPADNFSVGGAMLRDVTPSILSRLTPAQIADVRSGAGSLDVSDAIIAALNSCTAGGPPPTVQFPAGRYRVTKELVAQTCTVNIVLDAGADIFLGAGFTPNATTYNFGIFRFMPSAKGSSIRGPGTIDGNRGALIDAYLATPRSVQGNGLYVQRDFWSCIHIDATPDVTIDGVKLKNCMTFGIVHFAGDRARLRNIVVTDSSAILNSISSFNTSIADFAGYNIGNSVNGKAIPSFTYPFGVGDCYSCTVSNISIKGSYYLAYDGTSSSKGTRIGDPYSAGFALQRLYNTTITGLSASGFSTTLPGQSAPDARATQAAWGVNCDNCYDTTITNTNFQGYYWGALLAGSRVTFTNFVIDGQYNVAPYPGAESAFGIKTNPSGQIRAFFNSDSTFDHYSNKNSDNIIVSNGTVTRTGDGVSLASSNVSLSNIRSIGNKSGGFAFWGNASNISYPGSAPFPVDNVNLSGLYSAYNGGGGFTWNTGTNHRGSNLVSLNNGQESFLTNISAGFFWNAGFGGDKRNISISDWTAEDTQNRAYTTKVSFVPGTSQGKRTLIASNSSELSIGQRIKLKAAGPSGADITAKIIDITDDIMGIETAAGAAFDGTGCAATNLSGTVTYPGSSNLLNGTGTSFLSQIKGPVYLLLNGGYYKVGSVVSDTVLQLDSVPPGAISGASASYRQCGIEGIRSQNYGVQLPASSDISDVSLGAASSQRAKGNVTANISAATASLADDWTLYTANITFVDGTGVTVGDRQSRYRVEGKDLCVNGYAQIGYSAAPTLFNVFLPSGFAAGAMGGSLTGANTTTRNRLLGVAVNGDTGVSMIPITGSLMGGSGQYVQYGGCVALQ